MSLLAVDMGSSSCKAVAFSEYGRVLFHKTCQYTPFHSSHPSWAELQADNFWRAFSAVTQAVSTEVIKDPVEVLAISSHGETFVPVDTNQRAIAPAILNIDGRAVAESNALADALGRRHIFEVTGLAVHPMYPMCKLLWLREHQPDVFNSAARFHAVPDYLLARLGLPGYIDYSLASRFMAFDIRQKQWSLEILSACGLDAERLPTPMAAGTVVGKLAAHPAAELGLPAGTRVVLGGHDQPCAALGSGVLEPGRVSASLGTYECLVAASLTPALSEAALAANLNSYCHVLPDRYVTIAYFPSGIMMDWFIHLLYSKDELASSSVGVLCARLEAQSEHGPSGLCISPHLLGTCNPDFDPDASGVVAGIRPTTRRADLYKGILEGIACEFASMCDLLRETAGSFRDVYVSGGGVHSALGLKLRAALSGCRLHGMECSEAACQGAAILAGVAAGKFRSYAEAVEEFVRISESISSDAVLAESYKQQRLRYSLLYSSLAPVRRTQGAT